RPCGPPDHRAARRSSRWTRSARRRRTRSAWRRGTGRSRGSPVPPGGGSRWTAGWAGTRSRSSWLVRLPDRLRHRTARLVGAAALALLVGLHPDRRRLLRRQLLGGLVLGVLGFW